MNTTTDNLPTITPPAPALTTVFSSAATFEMAQRMGKLLSESDLVPNAYRGNLSNCVIALELAQRTGAPPFAVMQNLNIIQGKPSWSAEFVIAMLNTCGRFSPLRFSQKGKDVETMEVCAYSHDIATGEKITGSPVSLELARAEGWLNRTGSKWKSMPEQMLRYRAATFFARLYAPDLLSGMRTADELRDDPESGGGASVGPNAADLGKALAGSDGNKPADPPADPVNSNLDSLASRLCDKAETAETVAELDKVAQESAKLKTAPELFDRVKQAVEMRHADLYGATQD